MKTYHVEGWFEGDIESESKEEAAIGFSEFDIDSLSINIVYDVDEDDEEEVTT